MSEPEEDEELESDLREPAGVELNDGGVWIGDIDDFLASNQAIAVLLQEGKLFILTEGETKFLSLEEAKKTQKKGKAHIAPLKAGTNEPPQSSAFPIPGKK